MYSLIVLTLLNNYLYTTVCCFVFSQLITVYTVPGMDSDWLVGERGNQKGKVPVTYLELLS